MNAPNLVCSYDTGVFSRIQRRKLVVRVNESDAVCRIPEDVARSGNELSCVIYHTDESLSNIPFNESWADIPLALYAQNIGDFSLFIRKLPLIRQLKLRIYLPLDLEENYTNLMIFSSLGIASAALFGAKPVDWETLTDLMTYALLGRAPRGQLDPFSYIAREYAPERRTDWRAVYWDDPSKYLHVNEAGFVALSAQDLGKGRFIAESIDQLTDINQCEAYLERQEAWKAFFLDMGGCASCPGWRVCCGRFAVTAASSPGCREFFSELLDGVELNQSLQTKKIELWRQ